MYTRGPPPPTKLAHYRQFAPRAAIHVSPLCLGGMSIGDKWVATGFGTMDKESSFKLLDAYFDAGGNFIDTASIYQNGSSEQFIGEWAEERGIRDQLIISTKYANNFMNGDTSIKSRVNFTGNNLKSMKLSLDSSLKNLRTDYIDLFFVHYWDLHTSAEEIMDGLHNIMLSGKVLYLGISDSPAWFIVKANEYARKNGKTPFVVVQAPYSDLQRDLEREIIPMCRSEVPIFFFYKSIGMALMFWNVLAAGHIRSDEDEERRRQTGEKGRVDSDRDWLRSDAEKKMCGALKVVRKQVGANNITAVAIAYMMHKVPYAFPIIGGRKIEHLMANIEALDISINPEQMKYLDEASNSMLVFHTISWYVGMFSDRVFDFDSPHVFRDP
ncbi:hypothetical protein M422DRAFT_183637 [Sphaerobolus stellatus SS14]|uniref:NADP-dependent oxidoreductase domain-containing protein n=1 Tax=Sphaerobolus stellatus (strain SS14) TaxID=990650 RepID=A0A0C9UV53_SPHS4|nr:hypothetical protein M422DRAFT_183637 [Sphaerobolus stellatus SS14]